MAMRELIPRGRQESRMPARYGEDQRSPFLRLRQEMERLFDDLFAAPVATGGGWSPATSWPSLEVNETDDEVRITAELPGMNEKDIDLSIQEGVLTLSGERKGEQEDRERGWSERYYGRFERRLALPDGADEEHCEADFRDGVLTIRMPKTQEAARSRRIPINATTRH